MQALPSQFVLTRKPKEYLKQGPTHCGAYSVKAIIEAFGKGDKKDPRDYHTLDGGYSKLQAALVGHWITLWGYDDKKKVFYVYDSAASRKLYDDVPIGNKKRSYKQILRDWKGADLAKFIWNWEYFYIEVKN